MELKFEFFDICKNIFIREIVYIKLLMFENINLIIIIIIKI